MDKEVNGYPVVAVSRIVNVDHIRRAVFGRYVSVRRLFGIEALNRVLSLAVYKIVVGSVNVFVNALAALRAKEVVCNLSVLIVIGFAVNQIIEQYFVYALVVREVLASRFIFIILIRFCKVVQVCVKRLVGAVNAFVKAVLAQFINDSGTVLLVGHVVLIVSGVQYVALVVVVEGVFGSGVGQHLARVAVYKVDVRIRAVACFNLD